MDSKRETHLSKFLSLVLRHKPETVGLTLGDDGWVNVVQLLYGSDAIAHTPMTLEELRQVVANNAKKRFEFSGNETHIRAAQGHSVEVDLGYVPETPPNVLYHGTAVLFLPGIQMQGVRKMSRTHVHLSLTEATAWEVGKRHGSPCVLRVYAGHMAAHGFKFFKAANGVWLAEEVPWEYCELIDLPPHVRVDATEFEEWRGGEQTIAGRLADGRSFRVTVGGFDKVDAEPIVRRLAGQLREIISGVAE